MLNHLNETQDEKNKIENLQESRMLAIAKPVLDESIIEFLSKAKAGSVRQHLFLIGAKGYSFTDKRGIEIQGCSLQFSDFKMRDEENEIGMIIQSYSLSMSNYKGFLENLRNQTFPLEVVIEIKIETKKTRTASLIGLWPAGDIRG